MSSALERRAAITLTIFLIGLITFQLLLALGLPLGRAAWGGYYVTLPMVLRLGSLVSAALYVVAIVVALTRAGLGGASSESLFARYGAWAFTVLFLLGVLLNLASRSPWERWIMTPVALLLTLLFYVLARRKI